MTDERLDQILKQALTPKNTASELVIKKRVRKFNMNKFLKSGAAIAACAVLVIVGGHAVLNYTNPSAGNSTAQSTSTGLEKIIDTAANNFTLTAYTAEIEDIVNNTSELCMYDIGLSDGSYSGMYFKITGNNISHIDISIDNGELYTSSIEKTTEAALNEWLEKGEEVYEDGNSNTHSILQPEGDGNVTVYHCTRYGKNISEFYDEDLLYGFYIPDDKMAEIYQIDDLREGYLQALKSFEDAILSVDVTFADGSSLEKKYQLNVTKITTVKGVVEETNGDMFFYGLIATEVK